MSAEKDEITLVAPNGATRTEKLHPHDTVDKTLEHAVRDFAKDKLIDASQQYVLALGEAGLDGSLTLEQAGVRPGDRLKIRAKKTPVDGNAPGA